MVMKTLMSIINIYIYVYYKTPRLYLYIYAYIVLNYILGKVTAVCIFVYIFPL